MVPVCGGRLRNHSNTRTISRALLTMLAVHALVWIGRVVWRGPPEFEVLACYTRGVERVYFFPSRYCQDSFQHVSVRLLVTC